MNWAQVANYDLADIKKEDKWSKLAGDDVVEKTIESLLLNGIDAQVVATSVQAKEKVLSMIPKGADILTATSVTLDALGITSVINGSGDYDAVKPKLMTMDRAKDSVAMQKLGAAPEWVVGSVHAVTQDGKVVIASNSGSQLPSYAYGAAHVIWVVSTKKIVANIDEAFKRVEEYSLPLESERASKAYGVPGSYVSKMLIVNQEMVPERIKLIFVKEVLGF